MTKAKLKIRSQALKEALLTAHFVEELQFKPICKPAPFVMPA